ncbi:hypothetical protein EV714DRAFT_220470 [Schizophyllum commune]
MHRVLEIPELQLAIAQELIPPETSWYRRRTDLHMLSLVSHSWRSIAEPMRWEEGSTLDDILRILPTDAWAMSEVNLMDCRGHTTSYRKRWIHRQLESHDWSALMSRTRFVRSFTLCQHVGLQETFGNMLPTMPPADVLFPKLLELVLAMDDYCLTQFTSIHAAFILAITPNLARLVIKNSCCVPSHAYIDTLSQLARRSHGLQSVVLDTRYACSDPATSPMNNRPSPYRNFFQAIHFCPLLTTVKLDFYASTYDSQIIPILAAHPKLQSLTLELERLDPDDLDMLDEFDKSEALLLERGMIPIPTPSFPSLRDICSVQLPQAILRALIAAGNRTIPLSSLRFHTDIPDYADFHGTLSAVRAGCDPATLTELSVVYFCKVLTDDTTINVLDMPSLAQISSFARLSVVKLDGLAWVNLSDADYAEVARWWPELVSLAFVTDRSTPACSLAALIPFRLSCPRLEYLELALSAEEVPTIPSSDTRLTTTPASPRFELFVRDSPIAEDVDSVALFLFSLFPTIQKVSYDLACDDDDFHQKNWDAEVVQERRAAWGKLNELIGNYRNACM